MVGSRKLTDVENCSWISSNTTCLLVPVYKVSSKWEHLSPTFKQGELLIIDADYEAVLGIKIFLWEKELEVF